MHSWAWPCLYSPPQLYAHSPPRAITELPPPLSLSSENKLTLSVPPTPCLQPISLLGGPCAAGISCAWGVQGGRGELLPALALTRG